MSHWKKVISGGTAGVCLLAAQAVAQTEERGKVDSYLGQLERQGWTQVAPGVLQRSLGDKQVESLAYGESGLEWAIEQAENRYGEFLRLYLANPTKDGESALLAQAEEVERRRDALKEAPRGDGFAGLEAFLNSGCNVSYGATASAYPLTTSQGVGATASAFFNNSCGYVGNVYAYAYVAGRVNNTYTTSLQRDPSLGVRSGTNISASASRTLAATADCYSYAEASANVPSQGINHFFVSGPNYSCPAPPSLPSVSISGSTYVFLTGFDCETLTWTATGSGGTLPYSYAWYFNNAFVASGSTYSRTFCGTDINRVTSHALRVTLTDGASRTASDSETVTVQTERECGPGTGRLCQ